MLSQELLRSEAAHYRDLAEQLRATYSGIDDETLADTLSGINELPDMIEEIVRSSLEDQCVIAAIKLRAEDLKARLERFEQRVERKRALACWAMGSAGIPNCRLQTFRLACEKVSCGSRSSTKPRSPTSIVSPSPPSSIARGWPRTSSRVQKSRAPLLRPGFPISR